MSTSAPEKRAFTLELDDRALAGEEAGEGPPVVLLHGLTAGRRYVVHGSKVLPRRGYRTLAYDARGHGESDPAPEGGGYSYGELADDLGRLIEQLCGDRRCVLAGHSMGAHTLIDYALATPERVAGIVAIGPGCARGAGEPRVAGLLGPARRRPRARRGRGLSRRLRS